MQEDHDKHQWAWELLPWLANGSLDESERTQIKVHLDGCTLCQEELARCRGLATAVAETNANDWLPSSQHMAGLLAKLPLAPAPAAPRTRRHRQVPFWQRWLEDFGALKPAIRWTLALETGLLAALMLVLVAPRAPQAPQYETLSSAPSQTAALGPRLRVVFRADTLLGEMRQLLNGLHAQIVQGPSDLGVMTLALPPSPKNGADPLRKALETLRANPKVVLAEPLPSS